MVVGNRSLRRVGRSFTAPANRLVNGSGPCGGLLHRRRDAAPEGCRGSLHLAAIRRLGSGVTDSREGWSGYGPLKAKRCVHEIRVSKGKKKTDEDFLPNAHQTISLSQRWLLETPHGAVSQKHPQFYLDEYTFRHNRRKSNHVGKIFYRLVRGVFELSPTPYWKLVVRTAPDQPLRVVVI